MAYKIKTIRKIVRDFDRLLFAKTIIKAYQRVTGDAVSLNKSYDSLSDEELDSYFKEIGGLEDPSIKKLVFEIRDNILEEVADEIADRLNKTDVENFLFEFGNTLRSVTSFGNKPPRNVSLETLNLIMNKLKEKGKLRQ